MIPNYFPKTLKAMLTSRVFKKRQFGPKQGFSFGNKQGLFHFKQSKDRKRSKLILLINKNSYNYWI